MDLCSSVCKTGSGGRTAVAVGCSSLSCAYLGLFVRVIGTGLGRPGLIKNCLLRVLNYHSGQHLSPAVMIERLGGWFSVDAGEEWAAVMIGVQGSNIMDGYSVLREIVRSGGRCKDTIGDGVLADGLAWDARGLLWPCGKEEVECRTLWREIGSEHVTVVGVSGYDPESVAEDLLATVGGLGRSRGTGASKVARGVSPGFQGQATECGRDRLAVAFGQRIDTPMLFAKWSAVARLLAGGKMAGVISCLVEKCAGSVRICMVPGRMGGVIMEIDCPAGQSPVVLEMVLRQMEALAKGDVDEGDLRTARTAAVTGLKAIEDDPGRRCELMGVSQVLFGRMVTARWTEAVCAGLSVDEVAESVGELLLGNRALAARVSREHEVSLALLESIWGSETRV